MPAIQPNTNVRVLVSGANGYIALWVVQTLLEQGYTVRGAVRSEAKGRRLRESFPSYGDKIESVVVEDIVKDGAFDEAVKDVDAIEHMASPVDPDSEDPDDFIIPAVQGTVGIMKSALKFGTKVKRIILTSSVASVISTLNKPGIIFDETHWADYAVQAVKEQGKGATSMMKYRASKTLAEKAAWEFYNEHKTEIGWDLVAINPPLVSGPTFHEVKTPADLNMSLEMWWDNVTKTKSDDALKLSFAFIDVRDAAAAHVAALSKPEAGGERIIPNTGAITWQGVRNILYTLHPGLYTAGILPRGNPELDTSAVLYDFNPEKGKRVLGLQYRSLEETIRDTFAAFQAKGWLEKPVQS